MQQQNESEKETVGLFTAGRQCVCAMKVRAYRQIYKVSYSNNNNYMARYKCNSNKPFVPCFNFSSHNFPPLLGNLSQIDNRTHTLCSDYTPFACIGHTDYIDVYI